MEQTERVHYLCHIFNKINRGMMHCNRNSFELRPGEAGALWTIGQAGAAGIHPAEVSRRMSMARPSLTPILRELEEKGLIRRVPDPIDKRRCLLAVTDRFWEVRRVCWQEHAHMMERLLSGLSENEVEILCGLLHKIEEALPDRYEERTSKEDGR